MESEFSSSFSTIFEICKYSFIPSDVERENCFSESNALLNKKINKAHPTVWIFLEILKTECQETDQKLIAFAAGHRIHRPATKYQRANQMLASISERYISGSTSVREMIEAATYYLY